jgi:hypothetical protein
MVITKEFSLSNAIFAIINGLAWFFNLEQSMFEKVAEEIEM